MPEITDTERIPPLTQAASTDGSSLNGHGPDEAIEPIHERTRRRSVLAAIGRWSMALSLFLSIAAPLLAFSLVGAVVWQARTDEAGSAQAIVVLGAAQYNGRPSNVLQARLDHALTLYQEGLAPVIVVTGGRAPGDGFSEAEASRDYLMRQGVPESAILMEDVGRDTWQSMQGVDAVLAAAGIDRILIVSDGFHLLRGKVMARELGFAARGSAAPDSPIEPWSAQEFGYVVRETAGILAFIPKLVG